MANRLYQQFSFGLVKYPVVLHGKADIGASGATSNLVGAGVSSLTRLAAGVYALKLEDNYNRFYNLQVSFESPLTGADITAGSFVVGTLYEITALGTTDWTLIGLPAGLTPAVGVSFVATGVGSGTGTVKAFGTAGIFSVQLVGNPQVMDAPSPQGAYVYFRTMNASNVNTDPTSGSVLYFTVTFRNSSVKDKGE
jgi:hypothetical protein